MNSITYWFYGLVAHQHLNNLMEKIHPILNSIQASYRGRIPTRADGKKRREKILKAVRDIIVEHGVQGVKHRAIAEMADVPLAATTYYFPDIHALLHDAFLDFCERNINQLQSLETAGRELFDSFASLSELADGDYQVIRERLTDMILRHISVQVKNKDDRMIERAFRNESLRNPELAQLVNDMELQQLNAIAQFFQALGSNDPDSDSRELIAIILYLEHSLLAGFVSESQALQTLQRTFTRLVS
ncbi:TetR/AcrR family transcriptional regulator [Aliikangiella coralliicola]|uniref:TetR family transcriptional regulator n=1 Tax=Aliikangiella coralliicola TaxID=2592383 RepID=A0A545U6E8_9GAMM|nr:TetR family transcriptional regulator [Aliikangiella coralliicola]TQV85050.1 TetR family transcriptional regulator [Aliikangiella coralliicola]